MHTSQHPRIVKLVGEKHVRVQRNEDPHSISTIVVNDYGCWNQHDAHPDARWDAEGRAALRHCIQCVEATGLFAALDDSSALPYAGKRMRAKWGCSTAHVVLACKAAFVWYVYVGRPAAMQSMTSGDLLPLVDPTPPAQKVRAMTPVEAVAHLGRLVISHCGLDKGRVCAAEIQGVWIEWSLINSKIRDSTTVVYYTRLASDYKWADDNSPCGVVEQPER